MRFITLSLAVCFAATLVVSAPTEDSTSKIIDAAPDSANTSSSDSIASTAGQNQARATAPGANMIDAHAHLANSTFTCLNRQVGYYADIESDCKVYHFCLLGDYNGQEVYQRVTYMCLNETTFDQRALDCVETSKMSTTCSESAKLYDESNAALRKAVAQSATEAEKKAEEKKDEEKKDEEKKDEEKKDEEKKAEEKKDEEKKAEEKKEAEKKDDDKQE